MQNFADQCLDLAQSILSQNISSINEDGSVNPIGGESSRLDEPGHAALALGEYYRATNSSTLDGVDIVDLAARCITAQAFTHEEAENGLAYAALGLLSFGPAKDRNPVWERLVDETQVVLDRRLLARSDYDNHHQAFNVAKSVARFSMGLSKKDETGRLIDLFIERIGQNSSGGFCDDHPKDFGGVFDIYGVLSFVFIRQALQLHANAHLRERKLPSLRTYAEKYIKLFPDIVRQDGLGWCYGRGIGAYGQMHCISMIMQALRDDWITADKKDQYIDIVRKMFHFFFATYLDQENGFLVISDDERSATPGHTSRMANFDAARYLCQWSRLARTISSSMQVPSVPPKSTGKLVFFDKSSRKEQALFIYQNANSGLQVQIPLVSSGAVRSSDSLAFPHAPGIFDWPVNKYLPIMLPELTFGEHVIIPSFYGMKCSTGLGLKRSFIFKYEQPELITKDEVVVKGLGGCKVSWTFSEDKIVSEFIFTMKDQVTMDSMRYVLAFGAPHTTHRMGTTFTLGEESLRANVIKDDFQAVWKETDVVSEDPEYSTYYGKLHYLQTLSRDHPLVMRPGQPYKLVMSFEPDLAFADE